MGDQGSRADRGFRPTNCLGRERVDAHGGVRSGLSTVAREPRPTVTLAGSRLANRLKLAPLQVQKPWSCLGSFLVIAG
jgi:hypothetical protein